MTDITSNPGSTIINKTGGWRTFIPKIDLKTCISCGNCERCCPECAIELKTTEGYDKEKPEVNFDFCKGCGLCAAECPVKAIKMEIEIK